MKTQSNNYSIYLDVDGVLADFDKGVFQLLGQYPNTIEPKSQIWKAIQEVMENEGEFFGALELLPDAMQLFDFVDSLDCELHILTATGHIYPELVDAQKRKWVAASICPNVPVLTTRNGKEKSKFAESTHILIDDRMKSIGPWREAGGIGILHTSAEDTINQLNNIISNTCMNSSDLLHVTNTSLHASIIMRSGESELEILPNRTILWNGEVCTTAPEVANALYKFLGIVPLVSR